MGIDRLRYFAAVVETKNLRVASELVGIAPASMSKAISVLEDELGCKLIHPDGRGIGITPKGLEVYKLSASLLEEYQRFFQNVRESESHAKLLRFATFEVFSTYLLSAFFDCEQVTEAFLLEMPPGKIEQAILTGTIDLGVTYLPSPDPALEFREIGSFEMGIFGHKKWEAVPFREWPFAIPTTELRIHSSEIDSIDMWPKSAPRRLVKYKFELLETALQTSRRGLSVLHCPDFIVRLQNEQVKAALQLVQLTPPSGYRTKRPIKVYLAARKGTVPVDIERKLAKLMRSMK